jgi:hypothetical protein
MMHVYYSITRPPVRLETWPGFKFNALCNCNIPTLAEIKGYIFLCHAVRGLQSSFICRTVFAQSTVILSAQLWITVWNFLVANDALPSFNTLLTERISYLRSSLLWDVTQRKLVVPKRR